MAWQGKIENRVKVSQIRYASARQAPAREWGKHPIADIPLQTYAPFMTQKDLSRKQNQKTPGAPLPTLAAPMSQDEIDITPSPDEVARRAYFAYENQGSRQGHEVQHWLKAEAELIAERKLTRTHGCHNHPLNHNQQPTIL